jgi:hypothetical protein
VWMLSPQTIEKADIHLRTQANAWREEKCCPAASVTQGSAQAQRSCYSQKGHRRLGTAWPCEVFPLKALKWV